MEEQKPSFYANIPAFVRYNKNLSPNAKLLYGEITALCNQEGYCWSTNEYFSKLYDVSHKSIGRWITDIENEGYITRELIYKEGSKEVKQRRLYLCEAHRQKCQEVGTKMSIPMDKNVVDNNTINNTINKDIKTYMPTSKFEGVKEIMELYDSIPKLPKYRGLSDKRKSHIKARLEEYEFNGVKEVLIKCHMSDYLSNNPGNWFNIDWIFNPTNFLKILEGKYDNDKNRNNYGQTSQTTKNRSALDRLIESEESNNGIIRSSEVIQGNGQVLLEQN